MALGQPLLDARLPLQQPVHRLIQFVLVDVAEAERRAQGRHRALGRQGAGGGQLRLRVDDAGGEQGHGQVAGAAGAAGEQGGQGELLQRAHDGGDMAVGQAAQAGEGLVGRDEALAAQDPAQRLDGGGGQLGEVGEGAFFDAAAVAVGLAEEDGWGRVAVGHALYVHGYNYSRYIKRKQGNK